MNPTTSSLDTTSPIIFDYQIEYAKVTLNRPQYLNAINLDMVKALQLEAKKWESDPNLKVVLFSGTGGKAFCAGGDIKSLYTARKSPSDNGILLNYFKELFDLFYLTAHMKPIQIAFWDGIVVGGGIGISVHAPIKIATETCQFILPETKIGAVVDGYLLNSVRGHLGTFLGLTGCKLKGEEVVQYGLADFYVKREKLPALEKELLENINNTTKVEDLIAIVKKYEESTSKTYKHEELINKAFGKSSLEEIYKELEEATEDQEFAQEVLKMMKENSPISMKIALEQIKKGEKLSFEENIKMDNRIAKKIIDRGTDFFEGIRCSLVDRGSKPNWEFKTIYDVPDKVVEAFFEIPQEDLEVTVLGV